MTPVSIVRALGTIAVTRETISRDLKCATLIKYDEFQSVHIHANKHEYMCVGDQQNIAACNITSCDVTNIFVWDMQYIK